MAQRTRSTSAIVFLIAALLFYSCPSSGNRVQKATRLVPDFENTGNQWQAPEQLEGEGDSQVRMVDSDVTQENEYPYMVALMMFNPETETYSDLQCGGSLISRTQILTAAHCVCVGDTTKVLKTDQLMVFLGVHFFNGTTTDAQLTESIRKIKVHEKYDPGNWYNNDIAVLTLKSPVKFTEIISPVCLPPQGSNDQYEGQMAIVKGWGSTGEGETVSEVLLHAVKNIISNSKCQKLFEDAKITNGMMCAYRRGKDTCQGDSGGPVVIESNDLDDNITINTKPGSRKKECKWIQVGIVSWGTGCARKGIPGVYARVTSFLPWIKKQAMPVKSKFYKN